MNEKQITFEFHCEQCTHRRVCSIRDLVADAMCNPLPELPSALSAIFKCKEYREDIAVRTPFAK